MAYVDLNPIRARLAAVPEDSAFTSIAERLRGGREGDGPDMESVTTVPNGDPATVAADHRREAAATQKPGAVPLPLPRSGDQAALETTDPSYPSALEPLPPSRWNPT